MKARILTLLFIATMFTSCASDHDSLLREHLKNQEYTIIKKQAFVTDSDAYPVKTEYVIEKEIAKEVMKESGDIYEIKDTVRRFIVIDDRGVVYDK